MGKKFGRKASGTSGDSSFDKEAWDKWNKYLFECMPVKRTTDSVGKKKEQKRTKTKVLTGKVNYVFDCGLPVGDRAQFKTKVAKPEKGEDYSQEEIDDIKAQKERGRDVDYEWIMAWDDTVKKMTNQRFQTSDAQPAQEYGIAVDFYQWMVDYSKHPNAAEDAPEDLRPFRISINGLFAGAMQRGINFEAKWNKELGISEVNDKNTVYNICKASNLEEELIESEFDIGTIAEAVCNYKVTATISETTDDKIFFNYAASTPTAIQDIEDLEGEVIATVEQQVAKLEKCDKFSEFTGVLLTMPMEDYTDELLAMVGNDPYGYVKRAEMSRKVVLSGIKADGEEWSFPKGIHLTDEDGEELWGDDNRPILGDYEDTNFAKAYEAWKNKKAKDSTKSEGKDETKKPVVKDEKEEVKPTPKPEEKPQPDPEPEEEEADDFYDDIPF